MSLTPLQRAAAPSSNLLRFLRAQNGCASLSESTCQQRRHPRLLAQLSTRTHADRVNPTATSQQPLESSLAPVLGSLWPRKRITPRPQYGTTAISTRPGQVWNRHLSQDTRNGSGAASKETSQDESNLRENSEPESDRKDQGQEGPWRRKFWARHMRPKTPLEPNDLPDRSGFLDDDLGRALRPANELKLRCTEFDENGNVVLVNGEFKKTELIAKYGLLPRDLRKIDSSLLPSILVRPSAILINLLHLRCLIKHNRVLVFDAYGTTDSYTQSLFMYDLEGKLRSPSAASPAFDLSHSLPYEFRALEAVLISVTNALESEFETVREPVVRVLRELEEDIDRDKLRHLLIYSKKLSSFERKATLVRDAIDDLLEADDDLAAMYLSEKAEMGRSRPEDDHTEVEMLLESYHKVCDEIVQVSGNVVANIRNTEEVIRAILDANRNALMLMDLKFSIGTLGLSGGTFVAALYGMNLKNFIEESDWGFWAISGWCTLFGAVVCLAGLKRLRRVQRLSMFGGDEKKGGESGQRAWDTLQQPVEAGMLRKQMREARALDESMSHVGRPGKNFKRHWYGEHQFR